MQEIPEKKRAILLGGMNLVREQGYGSTTVDQICAAAGVTKGAFFHYFKTKDEMALAAADFFSEYADALFSAAPYHQISDPKERLLAYIQLRREILVGEVSQYTCLLGTLAQEVHSTHPEIREACHRHIWSHALTLESTIAAAAAESGVEVDSESFALYVQAVLQGAFILAKASHSEVHARACIDHLLDHIDTRFPPPQ